MHKLIALFSFLLIFQIAQAQTKEFELLEAQRNWDKNFYQTMRYPKEGLRSRSSGLVSLALKFDSNGAITSYQFDKKDNEYFNQEVLKAFEKVKSSWDPILLEDRDRSEEYLIVFSFEMTSEKENDQMYKDRAVRLIQKNKPEKALKIVDRLASENPFNKEFLEFRSQINRQLGNEEEAIADLEKIQRLDHSVISWLSLKVFGVTSTRQVSGQVFN